MKVCIFDDYFKDRKQRCINHFECDGCPILDLVKIAAERIIERSDDETKRS